MISQRPRSSSRRPRSLLFIVSLIAVALTSSTLAAAVEEHEFEFPTQPMNQPNDHHQHHQYDQYDQYETNAQVPLLTQIIDTLPTQITQTLLAYTDYLPTPIANRIHHIHHLTRHSRHLASSDKCAASASFICPTTSCPEGYTTVSDCTKCDGYLFADYQHGICYDRKLFHTSEHILGDAENHYPFLWADVLGAFVWFFTAGIATACGVGGGGIYVPMGILLLRFPPKPSSGLSQASIFGASLGGLLINSRNRHPDTHIRDTRGTPLEDDDGTDHKGKIASYEKDKTDKEIEADRERYLKGGDGKRKFYSRPVIDYDMALFLAPMEMAGAVLGVIVQRLFPNWLFLSAAAVILGFTSFKTFKKFKVAYKKDKAKRAEKLARENAASKADGKRVSLVSAGATEDVESNGSNTNEANGSGAANVNAAEEGDKVMQDEEQYDDPKELEKRRHFLEMDSRQYPKEKILALAFLWAGLTVITFLKGGKGVDSVIGITCEDPAYYVLVASQFIWTMGFAAAFAYKGIRKTRARLEVNYPFNENDVLWDFKKVQYYSFFTFVAGVVAGLIGIGGGMVLGPLMLVMGIHPSVSTATTATMIVLTSSSVAVIFVMSGLVPWEYAVFFFFICFCGAILGKLKIDAYVKKTGMSSILIGVLATIIGLATLGCVVIMLLNLSKVDWCLAGFNKFCSVSSGELECTASRLLSKAEVMFPY